MPDIQLQNGHVRIPNEVANYLCRYKMNGEDRQVFDTIIMKTYGYNKNQDHISLSQFVLATGIKKPHIVRVINRLINRKIVIVAKTGNAKGHSYKINRNIEEWKSLPKLATPLPKLAPTIDNTSLSTPQGGKPDVKNSEFFSFFPGKITIQTFDDKKVRKDLTSIFHFDVYTVVEADHLGWLNGEGAGIYFCVNETDGKGRKAENVVKVRAVYADMDGSPLEKAMEFNPSLVVESSPGRFHCYWFTRDVPLNAFGQLQECIIKKLNSDPAVKDLPRVLRVPGFFHNKYEPYLTNIHSYEGTIFTFKELSDWFPPEPRKQFSGLKYKIEKPFDFSKFTASYGANMGEREAHVMKRAGGMIKRRVPVEYLESEIRKECSACNPPLVGSDVDRLIKSARRYMT